MAVVRAIDLVQFLDVAVSLASYAKAFRIDSLGIEARELVGADSQNVGLVVVLAAGEDLVQERQRLKSFVALHHAVKVVELNLQLWPIGVVVL